MLMIIALLALVAGASNANQLSQSDIEAIRDEAVTKINVHRLNHGVSEVVADSELTGKAQVRHRYFIVVMSRLLNMTQTQILAQLSFGMWKFHLIHSFEKV